MAEFIAFENGIKVNGQTIKSVLLGMGKFQDLGVDILSENNISDIKDEGWYSQQDWLNAFKSISEEIGANTLFNIGKSILDSAKFPPEMDTIEKGLPAIDVAYHMNHQKEGKVMFNPETGDMLEGIGNYGFEKTADREAKMLVNTPYPCDFDRGIITSMARKFEATADVKLDESAKNKKDGGDTSTYIVSW